MFMIPTNKGMIWQPLVTGNLTIMCWASALRPIAAHRISLIWLATLQAIWLRRKNCTGG